MHLDSDSAALMRLSLIRWGFPCPTTYLQIYQKYKGQGVPFPPDFRAMLRYRDPTIGVSPEREDIVPHGVLKDTVVRNRGAHLLLTIHHPL